MTTAATTERPALTKTTSGLIVQVTFFKKGSRFRVLRVRGAGHWGCKGTNKDGVKNSLAMAAEYLQN